MQIHLFGIPNCSTVRAARSWLADHGFSYTFHDFKKEGVTLQHLAIWQKALGWEPVLNRRGTTWRSLSEEERASALDAPSAATLLQRYPSLIKRPILVAGQQVHAGFSEAAYAALFSAPRD